MLVTVPARLMRSYREVIGSSRSSRMDVREQRAVGCRIEQGPASMSGGEGVVSLDGNT